MLLSYWLAIWLAAKWAGPERAQAAKDLAQSTLWAGLIASRFVYLALHATLYVDNPWAVIDIRDGGWHAPSGVVAMVLWLVWRLRERRGRWLVALLLSGCLLFAFTDAIQIRLQGSALPLIGSIPDAFIQAIPYVLTVVLLAGFMGKAVAPKAIGVPFVKSR